jgi:hypothetical protein
MSTGVNVRENLEKAVDVFERALALDPNSVEAQSRLAGTLIGRAQPKDPAAAAADVQRAEELIARALATSPGNPLTHRVKGNLLRFTRRCEEAIPELEISLAANRNNPDAFEQLSMCKFLTGGSNQEAIALTEQAIRFSPRDPNMQWWYTWIGFVHLLQSRIENGAISVAEWEWSPIPPRWLFNTAPKRPCSIGATGAPVLAVAGRRVDTVVSRGKVARVKCAHSPLLPPRPVHYSGPWVGGTPGVSYPLNPELLKLKKVGHEADTSFFHVLHKQGECHESFLQKYVVGMAGRPRSSTQGDGRVDLCRRENEVTPSIICKFRREEVLVLLPSFSGKFLVGTPPTLFVNCKLQREKVLLEFRRNQPSCHLEFTRLYLGGTSRLRSFAHPGEEVVTPRDDGPANDRPEKS